MWLDVAITAFTWLGRIMAAASLGLLVCAGVIAAVEEHRGRERARRARTSGTSASVVRLASRPYDWERDGAA